MIFVLRAVLTAVTPPPVFLTNRTRVRANIPIENAIILDITVAFWSVSPGLHGFTKSSSMIKAPEFRSELIVL